METGFEGLNLKNKNIENLFAKTRKSIFLCGSEKILTLAMSKKFYKTKL